MHGSPISRYDNRDLWRHYNFEEFGIVGEAYLSLKGVNYYSDTGRSWNWKSKMRDFMVNDDVNSSIINTTSDLVKYIKQKKEGSIYILVHPERWASGRFEWALCYLKDTAFNSGKKMLSLTHARYYRRK